MLVQFFGKIRGRCANFVIVIHGAHGVAVLTGTEQNQDSRSKGKQDKQTDQKQRIKFCMGRMLFQHISFPFL